MRAAAFWALNLAFTKTTRDHINILTASFITAHSCISTQLKSLSSVLDTEIDLLTREHAAGLDSGNSWSQRTATWHLATSYPVDWPEQSGHRCYRVLYASDLAGEIKIDQKKREKRLSAFTDSQFLRRFSRAVLTSPITYFRKHRLQIDLRTEFASLKHVTIPE